MNSSRATRRRIACAIGGSGDFSTKKNRKRFSTTLLTMSLEMHLLEMHWSRNDGTSTPNAGKQLHPVRKGCYGLNWCYTEPTMADAAVAGRAPEKVFFEVPRYSDSLRFRFTLNAKFDVHASPWPLNAALASVPPPIFALGLPHTSEIDVMFAGADGKTLFSHTYKGGPLVGAVNFSLPSSDGFFNAADVLSPDKEPTECIVTISKVTVPIEIVGGGKKQHEEKTRTPLYRVRVRLLHEAPRRPKSARKNVCAAAKPAAKPAKSARKNVCAPKSAQHKAEQ